MQNTKDKNLQWDLSSLFSSDDDPAIEKEKEKIRKAVTNFEEKWKGRDDYLSDPDLLKESLDDFEKFRRNFGTTGTYGYYFSLRRSQDQSNPELKAKAKKVTDFKDEMKDKIRFFTLSLMDVPEDKRDDFLNNEKLKPYRNLLKRKFRKAKYTLSEPEEKILSMEAGPAYSNWTSMRSEFFSKEERTVLTEEGKEETKPFSSILSLLSSKNKKVRDSAAEAFNDILESNIDVAEAEFNSVLEAKKITDKLRGLERPDLSRFIKDDIEPETVDTLIDTVTDNFDVSGDYYELKSKLFGVDKLEYHERNVPYGSHDKEYSLDEASKLIKKAFGNLDNEFSKIFEDYIENNQVDAYPRKGKRNGAFCAHGLITDPTYILLNYTKQLSHVTMFAHELGHGINNEFIKKNQNAVNFGTPKSTAEVASTFFEDFVLEEILKDADDELKLSVMIQKLDGDISTIYRQTAAINFEREAHEIFREKGYLSKEEIGKLFKKHMENYMGEYVKQSEGSENWWTYWPHLRRFFYNYSYASGLLISKALQRKVRDNSDFIDEVKKFLSTGRYMSPREIFEEIGIDITKESFWQSGLNETKDLLKETRELAKDLGKI